MPTAQEIVSPCIDAVTQRVHTQKFSTAAQLVWYMKPLHIQYTSIIMYKVDALWGVIVV